MKDDKTDQSHAGPLFDIGHRQIDIEDAIKDAKPPRKEKVTRTEVSDHMIIVGIS